jgi:hypothetical protein
LAIYVGYHRPIRMGHPICESQRSAVAAHPGHPVGA